MDFIATVLAEAKARALALVPKEPGAAVPSEKALRISRLCTGFGCNADVARRVLSVVIGEELPRSGVLIGQVVVPERNTNGSDYPLGAPTLILRTGDDYCQGWRTTDMGNSLEPSEARPATAEEVELFFTNLPAQRIKAFTSSFVRYVLAVDEGQDPDPFV